MKQTKLNIFSALLLLIAVGLGQSAWATTKTVTYTITQIETMGNDKEVTFTRSGDDPFDASATTYTCTIPQSALYPQTGAGNINLTLADGFSMTFQWGTGSNVMFNNNNYCIFPYDSQNTGKKITYTVSCSDAYYYVTHVMMTGMESNFHHGMQQTYPGSGSIDTDYDSEWNFSQTYYSQASFGQITLTYTDVPLISIFESAGENAYKIQDKHDLRHLANYVNNGKNPCTGLTFLQTQDITCDDTYMPIGYINGSDKARFCGTYDGQGHTISGITVSRTGTGEADGYVGVFGYIYYNSSTDYGTVRNIVLANSTFTGNFYVGGIVGYNWGGTIENCRVESTVIINAGHNGARYHGGIVGKNEDPNAKVIGCYSAAVVSKNNMTSCLYHGGIVGFNNKGTVQNCLYAGTTVTAYNMKGTIIGYDENGNGTFTNNYYTAINLGGVGANGSSSDQDGARRARTVTLGENVVIVGDETTYNVSGLTAIGTGNYALHSGNILYSGATQTLTLGYTAAIPDDFTFDGYSVKDADNQDVTVTENNGTYTFVMPDKNVTVTAILTDVWGIAGGADGSEAHPYLITTTAGLDLLATEVNNGNGFSGIYFKLGNDIAYDPNNLTIDNNGDGTNDSNYTAIGGNTRSFRGIFDGDGYAVSGINVNTSGNYQGLFGHVNDGGTVKNVTLRSSSITGKNNVGGIVGYAGNATVSNNIALGTNVSAYVDKGAIVGRIDSTPGLNYTLTHNYYHDCTVGNATTNVGTNVGDVTANDGAVQVFSLSLGKGITATPAPAVTCDGTGYYLAGTTVTFGYSGTVPAGQIPTYSLNGTAIVGNTFTLPANDATVAVTLVSLWSGNGTQGDPYLITTTSGLDLLATKVNNGNDFGGFYFKLGNDIEYDPTALDDNGENYTAIGVFDSQLKFSGTFDGDGHTISGIRINRPTEPNTFINSHTLQGLFGYLEGGTIKNVTVSDASITGCALVGAIVGVNNGTIENCQVAGTVSVTGANNGNGGIVGQNYGTIENCQVTGTVSVSGTNNGRGVGGIVGQNYGTTKNCYVNGTVNVTSKRYVGGIAGENQGTIENCLVLGTSVMATNNRGSIVGYNNTNNQTYTCILSHNYYHDCTVNGATTNVGTGDGDVIANDGAVQAVIRMVEGYGESTESDHWTFISSPLSSNTTATNVVNLINTTTPENYDFYRLNNTTWENIKATSSTNHSDFTTLVNGLGYLYANKDNVGLVFKGTYNSGTTQDVALQQGYNLVGNPFADSAYINTPFYKMNAAGTGIEAVSEYWNNKIAVCTGVVVNAQASGNVTFSKTAPLHSTGNNGSLQIALAQTVTTRGGSSTETLDNAIVSFNEGSQLGKFYFGEQDANIYIPQDGKDYAIVSAEAHGEIPVCFKAHKNGEYTITVNCKDVIARSAATKQSIHLIDNLTGADVDLLTTPTYTFTAQTTDYPSRFKLVFSNGNQNDNESEDFAFISNGNLIVNGTGTLQIIDALGRTLFTKELSTFNSSLFTFNFTPGVYVLRLINGENVKTQKITIY